jgi:hypothetical protein
MNLQGVVRKGAIHLDDSVTDLEGKRVKAHLEVVEEPEQTLSEPENRAAWDEWVARGPQGPIDDQESGWM